MNERIIYTEDGYAVDTILLKSFSRNLAEDQIFNYFSSFGKITRVTHINAVDSLGFVKFDQPEAAATAFKMKHHMIAGHHVGVEITQNRSQYQPTINDDLPKESTTGTEFMDLNDDCIREILSRVHVIDLSSLLELSESKTSRNSRLNAIINDVFARKYKICDLNTVVSTMDEARRLLTNFGPLITELSMQSVNFCRNSLDEMNSNAVLGNLDSFSVESRFPQCKYDALSNLKKLSVKDCCFDCDLFAHCSALLELTVTRDIHCDVPIGNSILQYTFPALEIFRVCGAESDKMNFENFISRHKKLKTLHLGMAYDQLDFIPIIADSCSGLKTLSICIDDRKNRNEYEITVKGIASLRHLEALIIHGDDDPLIFIQQLKYLDSLKVLYLVFIRSSPEIMSAVLQLKMLEKLHFDIRDDNIRDFNPFSELYRLKQLGIAKSSDISLENFDIEYAVSRLPDLKALFIHKTNYKIDEDLHSKIVDARSRAGSDRQPLLIFCGGVAYNFGSKRC